MSVAHVRVSVPATSANLGPGFDALGLALDLHDVVEVEAEFGGSPVPVEVSVEGSGADDLPRDENHLVVRAMRACFEELGHEPTSLRLRCRNQLPHGRGLGSSAAAIVAGVLAARALAGAEEGLGDAADLDDAALLALAARLEGHPDNVAACLLGGLTIAWTDDGRARAVRQDVHPDVRAVVCVPDAAVSTHEARGLLPASVPHSDAARNAGRAALLVTALTGHPELLFAATDDRLHQAYREPAMRATIQLVTALRQVGHAAVVSGAGPSVLVLTTGGAAAQVAALAPGWRVDEVAVQPQGARVEEASTSSR